MTSPVPSELIRSTFRAYLVHCKASADERESAEYLLKTSLINLHVSEITDFTREVISAEVRCEIVVASSTGEQIGRRSIIGAQSKRTSGVDTTRYANEVVREALARILHELGRELEFRVGR
jgi:hypothetical protein